MATKTFKVPQNVTQVSSNFTKNAQGYYQGQAVFRPNSGYKFGGNIGEAQSNPQGYNVKVERPSGEFGLNSSSYSSFAVNSQGQLYFQLKAAAQITDTGNNYWSLPWRLECILEQTATPIPITSTLQNCVSTSLIPQTITANDSLNITLNANSGYVFNTAPRLEFDEMILDDSGNPLYYIDFTLSNNNQTATINVDLSDYDLEYGATVTEISINAIANAEQPPQTITITSTLQNCVSTSLIPQTITANDSLNITLNANSGYVFNTAPRLEFDEMILDDSGNPITYIDFTLSNNNQTATINVDLSDYDLEYGAVVTEISINAIANAEQPPTPQTITLEKTLTNCTTNAPNTISSNDTIINIVVNANANCEFDGAPRLYIIDGQGNPNILLFTLTSNNTIANYSFDLVAWGGVANISRIELIAAAVVVTPYTDKYGTINVYKVTEENLNAFSQKRFFNEIYDNQADTPQYRSVDLGSYVINVKRVYFDVGNTTNDVLKCGNYNTNINVQTPLNDNIVLECGDVEIPNYNKNIVDYDSEITVFLPFVGNHNISSDYVGKTVNLRYVCNLVTCETIAILSCENIDFDFVECTASHDIIIHTSETYDLKRIGNAAFNMQFLKGLTPYVIVKYFVDETEQVFNNDNKRVFLDSLQGFNKVVEVMELYGVETLEEQNEIIRQLENGVYFS